MDAPPFSPKNPLGNIWKDETGQMWSYMRVGFCRICREGIYEPVMQNVLVKIDDPFFCDKCRKGILKYIRSPEPIEE